MFCCVLAVDEMTWNVPQRNVSLACQCILQGAVSTKDLTSMMNIVALLW